MRQKACVFRTSRQTVSMSWESTEARLAQHVPGWLVNRYTVFLFIVAVFALTPAIPHSTTPELTWWGVAWLLIALVIAVGVLGLEKPKLHWANTLAPLLLYPAIHALRCADGNSASGFSLLVLLPVIWFALYGRLRNVILAIVSSALTLVLPIVVVGAPQYPPTGWRGVVLLIVLSAALGPLIDRLVAVTGRTNRALTRSETEMRATFERAPVGMAVTSLQGEKAFWFTQVNDALCVMFGRTAEELTGQPVHAFTHPDDVDRTDAAFEFAVREGVPGRVEKRYLHKSGRTIWAIVSYAVVVDDKGRPSHTISQIEDVSARRESEQALLEAYEADRAATERLAQLERMRAEMASTVSHELRTPLTSASGYVELLSEGDAGPLNDDQRRMLGVVSRSLTRLNRIVDDVLSIADTEQRQAAHPVATADAGQVVRAAVETVRMQAALRGQDLVTHNDVNDVVVIGDADRLERVFVNLLSNALKFSDEDGVVRVSAQRTGPDVSIAIIDNGVGISEENQERIFERFFRVHDNGDGQAAAAGSGLGLSIVHSIVTQCGGSIDVASELGKGSTFTVTLPVSSGRANLS
jgi:PAS domain S-box-containing protein